MKHVTMILRNETGSATNGRADAPFSIGKSEIRKFPWLKVSGSHGKKICPDRPLLPFLIKHSTQPSCCRKLDGGR